MSRRSEPPYHAAPTHSPALHRERQGRQLGPSESVLRTNVLGEGHPHANENDPRAPRPSYEKGAVVSMPTEHRQVVNCPECGQPAARVIGRELGRHQHEVTCICDAEHLWTTRWFAAREEAAG